MPPLLQLYLRVRNSRLMRVAFIGGIGVVVQTIVFESLGIWLELVRPSTAVLIGAEFGVLTNFLLNNRFSFNTHSPAPLWVRLLRFHLVVSGSLLIQWLCVFSAESLDAGLWGLRAAYVVGILIGFVFNYTGYRLWVWRHHESPNI